MTYGLKAHNAAGVVLIDDDFVTLAPAQRGAITPANAFAGYIRSANGKLTYLDWAYGASYRVTYPSPIPSVTAPVVAFCPRQLARGCFHAFHHTGGPGAWTGFIVGWHHALPGTPEAWSYYYGPAEYIRDWDYIAADPERCPQSDGKYGMRVWDSAGELVFDSGTPVLRIVRVLDQWERISSPSSYVRAFTTPWDVPRDGRHGFFAASLGIQLAGGGGTFVGTRLGVVDGILHARVVGVDDVSRARVGQRVDGGSLLDAVASQMIAGGILRTMLFELR